MYEIWILTTTNKLRHVFTWLGDPNNGVERARLEAKASDCEVEAAWAVKLN